MKYLHQSHAFRIARAFTLIELLIVMTVIIALMAMMLPAMNSYRERAAVRQNQALISSLVGAMNSFGVDTFFDPDPGPGQPHVYRAWYTAGDGFLDGDPAMDGWPNDPDLQAVLDRLLIGPEGIAYRGPARMLPIAISARHIEPETGRIIDSWGHPLRVLDPEAEGSPYDDSPLRGVIGIGLWSSGPSGDPDKLKDNIISWGSEGLE